MWPRLRRNFLAAPEISTYHGCSVTNTPMIWVDNKDSLNKIAEWHQWEYICSSMPIPWNWSAPRKYSPRLCYVDVSVAQDMQRRWQLYTCVLVPWAAKREILLLLALQPRVTNFVLVLLWTISFVTAAPTPKLNTDVAIVNWRWLGVIRHRN